MKDRQIKKVYIQSDRDKNRHKYKTGLEDTQTKRKKESENNNYLVEVKFVWQIAYPLPMAPCRVVFFSSDRKNNYYVLVTINVKQLTDLINR